MPLCFPARQPACAPAPLACRPARKPVRMTTCLSDARLSDTVCAAQCMHVCAHLTSRRPADLLGLGARGRLAHLLLSLADAGMKDLDLMSTLISALLALSLHSLNGADTEAVLLQVGLDQLCRGGAGGRAAHSRQQQSQHVVFGICRG